jgi:hypothetical protein
MENTIKFSLLSETRNTEPRRNLETPGRHAQKDSGKTHKYQEQNKRPSRTQASRAYRSLEGTGMEREDMGRPVKLQDQRRAELQNREEGEHKGL